MNAPTTQQFSMGMHRPPATSAGAPLLATEGARVIVGLTDPFGASIAPTRSTLFGPRGAYLFEDGTLFIADTGHHRLLGYRKAPTRDGAEADFVIGQPDFESEGRNALGPTTASTLNVPTGVAPYGEHGLMVADAWNNRVLIWLERPTRNNQNADLVLGQADFSGQDPNRGTPHAAADTMHWPFAARVHDGRLYVCDAGNRRVLVWRSLPTENGQPADLVLGQSRLDERSDNGGGDATAASMRWPHALTFLQHGGRDHLVVTDAGNNRVLIWDGTPDSNNAPACRILGQADAHHVDHNRGRYWPTDSTLNMPYAVDARGDTLAVADTASSRLLGYTRLSPQGEDGPDAELLTGQHTFAHKGDNRWENASRDTLCWPYGLQLAGETAVIADSGNNRVLLWPLSGSPSGAEKGRS